MNIGKLRNVYSGTQLKGTTDIGLVYQGDTSYALVGYLDSNYIVDWDKRRSTTGYAFKIGNSLISWKDALQPIVALSTIEEKYMALVEVAKEGIWLKSLNSNLKFPKDKAIIFREQLVQPRIKSMMRELNILTSDVLER